MTIELTDPHPVEDACAILTSEALAFVEALHHRFADRRGELLTQRRIRQNEAATTGRLDLLCDTQEVRSSDWMVAPTSRLLDEEAQRLRSEVDPDHFERYYPRAHTLIADLCLKEEFVDFLTLPAYEMAIADANAQPIDD